MDDLKAYCHQALKKLSHSEKLKETQLVHRSLAKDGTRSPHFLLEFLSHVLSTHLKDWPGLKEKIKNQDKKITKIQVKNKARKVTVFKCDHCGEYFPLPAMIYRPKVGIGSLPTLEEVIAVHFPKERDILMLCGNKKYLGVTANQTCKEIYDGR